MLLCFWIGLTCLQMGNAQQVELQFRLIDGTTKKPISDANIFLNNSSVGAASNANGNFTLIVSSQETQVLVITHLLYETLFIDAKRYHKLAKGDIIEMSGIRWVVCLAKWSPNEPMVK